jgi:hypothetical protein
MGKQIIKQPDGRFAVYCSISGVIELWDATEEKVVGHFVGIAEIEAMRQVRAKLVHVAADEPEKAYYQFAMTWQEALTNDWAHGGVVHRFFDDEEVCRDDVG